MCGRYTLAVKEEYLLRKFDIFEFEGEHKPRYNIAPTQDNPVVLLNEKNQRIMTPMRWGLIPHWAEDEAIGNRMINARIETVAQKPSFKTSLRKRRCLVPADVLYGMDFAIDYFILEIIIVGQEPCAFDLFLLRSNCFLSRIEKWELCRAEDV